MTETTAEVADVASGRIAIGVDVGGSGIKAAVGRRRIGPARSDRLRVPTPVAVDARTRSSPRSRAWSNAWRSRAAWATRRPVGIGLPGVTIDGRLMTAANIDPCVGRLPRRRTDGSPAQAARLDHQRRGRGRHRRDALRGRGGQAGRRHLPDPGHRASGRACSTTGCSSRTPSSARWRSAAAPPRSDPRRPPGSSAACPGRPGRSTSTSISTRDRAAHLAEPDDPRRRRQQERRPVHPAPDRALPGRAGPAPQRRGHHRRGDRGGEKRRRRPRTRPFPTTEPDGSP